MENIKRKLKAWKYRHEAFDEALSLSDGSIRLLELLPGRRDEIIKVRLFRASLDTEPVYRAISYVWGDLTKIERIKCNERDMHITAALHGALERIRHRTESVTLWADSICINQQDILERSHQVALMGSIYSKAAEVLIYLGPPDASGAPARAAKLIKEATALLAEEIEQVGGFKYLPRYYAKNQWDKYAHLDWPTLATMLRLPWFRRVWVWQEVGLATKATILYGDENIDWVEMMVLFTWIIRKCVGISEHYKIRGVHTTLRNWVYFDMAQRNENFNVQLQEDTPAQHLYLVIDSTTMCMATDSRDHIFAFLGHRGARTESGELIMQPDYSLTLNQTFTRFAISWVKATKQAFLLASVQHPSHPRTPRADGLPTWVPRWDKSPFAWKLHSHETRHTFDATQSHVFEPRFLNENMRLEVDGLVVSKIKRRFAVLSRRSFEPESAQNKEVAWIENVMEEIINELTQPPRRYDDLLATIADLFQLRSSLGKVRADCAAFLLRYPSLTGLLKNKSSCSLMATEAEEGDAERFIDQARYVSHARRVMVTETGYLGLGPRCMMEGDVCAAFLGAPMLYILRPSSGGAYLFVGECYVQGLMHGALISMMESGELTLGKFWID